MKKGDTKKIVEAGLTRKQKAFADYLISNPKDSATKAAQETYNATTYKSANVIAAENLAKPSIQIYLDEHLDKAKTRVVELVRSNKEDIALRASQDILDRGYGKATQRHEVQAQSVTINIDLTKPKTEGELDIQDKDDKI